MHLINIPYPKRNTKPLFGSAIEETEMIEKGFILSEIEAKEADVVGDYITNGWGFEYKREEEISEGCEEELMIVEEFQINIIKMFVIAKLSISKISQKFHLPSDEVRRILLDIRDKMKRGKIYNLKEEV